MRSRDKQYLKSNNISMKTSASGEVGPKSATVGSSVEKGVQKGQVMYGDLMNALCYTAFLPFYIYLWRVYYSDRVGPRNICIAFFWTTVFSWYSFLRESCLASALALIAMSASIAGMNIYEWPHEGDLVVMPQFIWSLLIISTNQPLDGTYRAILALIAFANAVVVAVVMYAPEKIPLLVAALAVYAIVHRQKGRFQINAQATSMIMAGSFAYYASYEMMSMYTDMSLITSAGGYHILKLGFFAASGLAATGSFREESEFKRKLEVMVEEKTREVRAHAERLRVVERALQHAETAMAVVNSNFEIVWCNAAMLILTGHSKEVEMQETWMNQGISVIWNILNLSSRDRDLVNNVFLGITDKNTPTVIMVDNRYLEVEMSVESNLSKENKEKQILVVLKDVTERRSRQQAEKAAAEKELAAKTMIESMQTLSHELRTPLQGIMGMTSLILDDGEKLAPDVRESMSIVMTSSRMLLTLINNMLDTRKCEAGRMDEFNLEPMDLSVALGAASDFCAPFAATSDVNLDLKPLPQILVQANPLRFQQVMINLISNAVKYSPVETSVTISTRLISWGEVQREMNESLVVADSASGDPEIGPVVVVSVSDQGKGILENQKDRVFARFAQLDSKPVASFAGKKSSTSQPSGTGLGLSLCVEFLSRMNGRIWVNNNSDKGSPATGSCFSFYLPVAASGASKGETKVQQHGLASSNSCGEINSLLRKEGLKLLPNLRVLIVDDTIINLKVLRRMMDRLKVGRVCTVDSGEKALSMLEEQEFDLVVTDLQMPSMSGIDLSEIIRAKDFGSSKRPVVYGLTADTSESTEARCMESGMERVLQKPISQNGISAALEQFAGTHLSSKA